MSIPAVNPVQCITRRLRGLRIAAGLAAVILVAACTPQTGLDLSLQSPAYEDPAVQPAHEDPAVQPAAFASASTQKPGGTRTGARGQRQESTAGDKYYIEYRSRSALSYGHTFVSVGRLNRDGSINSSEIAGLHPATESSIPWMIGHVLPVVSETGPSDGDTEEIYITARYRVTMDKARYDDLMAYIRNLQQSSPVWHAVFYNCNAFVGDIARYMGLNAPGNTLLFPKEYITELRNLNKT